VKQEALSFFTHTELTGVAMFLFMAVFIGSVIWTYRKRGKQFYEKMSRLPLQEDQHEQ
jgi:cbb3-type cytochrome oxidase subunit 3